MLSVPALGATLNGSGSLPFPAASGPTPLGVAAVLVPGLTGTWSEAAQPAWRGTFTGTGPVPTLSSLGVTVFDFRALPNGAAPVNTFVRFFDLDQTGEAITLRAFDRANGLIRTPWLNGPVYLAGAPGDLIPPSMPGYAWNGTAGEYRFEGISSPVLDPAVFVCLLTNQEVGLLEADKQSAGFNLLLAAPSAVPEPGTFLLLPAGLAAAMLRGRRAAAFRVPSTPRSTSAASGDPVR